MEELQEARRRQKRRHGWPTRLLQSCSCWSEETSKDPHQMMKEVHEEAEAAVYSHRGDEDHRAILYFF